MSRAELKDYLIEVKPRYLLVDEVDKLPSKTSRRFSAYARPPRYRNPVRAPSRGDAGDGRLRGREHVERPPPELVSRFEVLQFKPYTRPQFIEVCERILACEKTSLELATYIAAQVWDVLRNKDVREALRVSRLSDNEAEVDEIIKILKKYQPRRSKC